MNNNEILPRLNEVFRDVFGDSSLSVNENTTSSDIEDWDSLMHITLISAVENEFGMRFTMGEVSTMKNVGEMAGLIAART